MREYLELASGLLQKIHVFGMGDDRLAEIDATIDNRLLLLTFENAWNDYQK